MTRLYDGRQVDNKTVYSWYRGLQLGSNFVTGGWTDDEDSQIIRKILKKH